MEDDMSGYHSLIHQNLITASPNQWLLVLLHSTFVVKFVAKIKGKLVIVKPIMCVIYQFGLLCFQFIETLTTC